MSGNSSKATSSAKLGLWFACLFAVVFPLITLTLQAEDAPYDLAAAVRAVNQQSGAAAGIKAYVELELFQPGVPPQRNFGQLAYLLEGRKLYFKAFSPLTPHYFTLISKEDSFWLQIPKSRTIYTGPLSAIGQENMEMKLTPQDLRRMLLPEEIQGETGNVKMEEQPPYRVLSVYTTVGQGTFKERDVWIQTETGRVTKDVRYSVNGNPYLQIEWLKFQAGPGGTDYPAEIVLFKPTIGYRLTLRLKKWETGAAIPPTLFELKDTEGFKTETVSPA